MGRVRIVGGIGLWVHFTIYICVLSKFVMQNIRSIFKKRQQQSENGFQFILGLALMKFYETLIVLFNNTIKVS